WAGAIGTTKRNLDTTPPRPPNPPYSSVALVIGATGILGTSPLDILSRLFPLFDVTYLFYVSTVIPSTPNLQHVCLQTVRKHYVTFESLGKIKPHEPCFTRTSSASTGAFMLLFYGF
ncbi:3-oxo-Delta(4,5)-steroid 5-beta-reductase-like, partial [Asparagus officinalis]|uniref:3-oxo-Delta(4,5)-steroid 5-beta-reductase-like n=1 Tax=Asparagus officinalis TaxID=4686 RepID=UPI00098E40C5